jgi:hypothetical protein
MGADILGVAWWKGAAILTFSWRCSGSEHRPYAFNDSYALPAASVMPVPAMQHDDEWVDGVAINP